MRRSSVTFILISLFDFAEISQTFENKFEGAFGGSLGLNGNRPSVFVIFIGAVSYIVGNAMLQLTNDCSEENALCKRKSVCVANSTFRNDI